MNISKDWQSDNFLPKSPYQVNSAKENGSLRTQRSVVPYKNKSNYDAIHYAVSVLSRYTAFSHEIRWEYSTLFQPFSLELQSFLRPTVSRPVRLGIGPPFQSQSQSYFTTDGQSVSMSWCRAQLGTFDQRYYTFFFLKVTVLSYLGRPLWREVGSVICQSTVSLQ
jgi:hypothetical protein